MRQIQMLLLPDKNYQTKFKYLLEFEYRLLIFANSFSKEED